MQPVSAFVVFVVIWWTVIFCVLPIGVSSRYDESDTKEGEYTYPGSPDKLDMKKKLLLTTVISIVLWFLTMAFILSGVFDFYDYASEG